MKINGWIIGFLLLFCSETIGEIHRLYHHEMDDFLTSWGEGTPNYRTSTPFSSDAFVENHPSAALMSYPYIFYINKQNEPPSIFKQPRLLPQSLPKVWGVLPKGEEYSNLTTAHGKVWIFIKKNGIWNLYHSPLNGSKTEWSFQQTDFPSPIECFSITTKGDPFVFSSHQSDTKTIFYAGCFTGGGNAIQWDAPQTITTFEAKRIIEKDYSANYEISMFGEFELELPVQFLAFAANLADGNTISSRYRISAGPNDSYGPWSEYVVENAIQLSKKGQYFQYQLAFVEPDSSTSKKLPSVVLTYREIEVVPKQKIRKSGIRTSSGMSSSDSPFLTSAQPSMAHIPSFQENQESATGIVPTVQLNQNSPSIQEKESETASSDQSQTLSPVPTSESGQNSSDESTPSSKTNTSETPKAENQQNEPEQKIPSKEDESEKNSPSSRQLAQDNSPKDSEKSQNYPPAKKKKKPDQNDPQKPQKSLPEKNPSQEDNNSPSSGNQSEQEDQNQNKNTETGEDQSAPDNSNIPEPNSKPQNETDQSDHPPQEPEQPENSKPDSPDVMNPEEKENKGQDRQTPPKKSTSEETFSQKSQSAEGPSMPKPTGYSQSPPKNNEGEESSGNDSPSGKNGTKNSDNSNKKEDNINSEGKKDNNNKSNTLDSENNMESHDQKPNSVSDQGGQEIGNNTSFPANFSLPESLSCGEWFPIPSSRVMNHLAHSASVSSATVSSTTGRKPVPINKTRSLNGKKNNWFNYWYLTLLGFILPFFKRRRNEKETKSLQEEETAQENEEVAKKNSDSLFECQTMHFEGPWESILCFKPNVVAASVGQEKIFATTSDQEVFLGIPAFVNENHSQNSLDGKWDGVWKKIGKLKHNFHNLQLVMGAKHLFVIGNKRWGHLEVYGRQIMDQDCVEKWEEYDAPRSMNLKRCGAFRDRLWVWGNAKKGAYVFDCKDNSSGIYAWKSTIPKHVRRQGSPVAVGTGDKLLYAVQPTKEPESIYIYDESIPNGKTPSPIVKLPYEDGNYLLHSEGKTCLVTIIPKGGEEITIHTYQRDHQGRFISKQSNRLPLPIPLHFHSAHIGKGRFVLVGRETEESGSLVFLSAPLADLINLSFTNQYGK